MSDFIVNRVRLDDNEYDFAEDGHIEWGDLNIEGQAQAVETWFHAFKPNPALGPDHDLDSVQAQGHPLFPYIRDHIRTGQG